MVLNLVSSCLLKPIFSRVAANTIDFQDNLSTLDILAFTSNGEGKDIRATVRLDSNIHFNVISTAQAHAACLPWSISEKPKTAIDSNGNCYESSKYLSLRWCEANKTKTWDAVFYIVNDCPHDIILDEASLPRRRADSGCYPVASAPITEGERR